MNKLANLELNNLETMAKAHLLTPSEDMSTIGTTSRPLIVSGEGIYVYNALGNRLIDGPAGMWCTQIGYGRREIADALSHQALELSYNSPWYTTNSPATELAARIAEHTPGDLNRVFSLPVARPRSIPRCGSSSSTTMFSGGQKRSTSLFSSTVTTAVRV